MPNAKSNPYGATGEPWRQRWRTPPELIKLVESLYGSICLDVAADSDNVCPHWLGPGSPFRPDGLAENWGNHTDLGCIVWCNPPYNNMSAWAAKCAEEADRNELTIIMLCNVCPETEWWRSHITTAQEVHYLYPRVQFVKPPGAPPEAKDDGNGNRQALVVWRPNWTRYEMRAQLTTSLRWK